MDKKIYNSLLAKKEQNQKMVALLIDPDKCLNPNWAKIIEEANTFNIDIILVGGSLLTDGDINKTVGEIKDRTSIPVILFPGSTSQISAKADAILFLSLLSSRNAEMIIGQQVTAAPYLRKTTLEVISTAYLLIDSGMQTTASYMSNSTPIPANKPEIAASTALAGVYLGMNIIYLDGGSGAINPVSEEMIKKVKSYTDQLLFIGGGLNSVEKIKSAFSAGADLVVIGNAIEKNPTFIKEIGELKAAMNA